MSDETALYRVFGDADLLLYIGISDDFGRRWTQHAKQQPWWGEKRRLSADEWFDRREDAEAAEEAAIKAERPKYNKRHMGPGTYSRSRQRNRSGSSWDIDVDPATVAVIIAAAKKSPQQTPFICMDANVACLRGGFGCIGNSNASWPCLLKEAADELMAEAVTGEEARRLITAAAADLREGDA